jgi:hypothetical protein
VADDAHHAGRADGEQRQVVGVVAGVVGQAGRGQHGGGRGEVVLGVLHGDDLRVLGQREDRLGAQRDAGAHRDVVEHHRQVGGD